MDDAARPDPSPTSDFESGMDDDDRLDLKVWLRLLTCTTLIDRHVRQNLRTDFGTTLPRFDVLAQIDRSPEGQPMRELSRRLMVTDGNITPLIDRLVDEGLVERKPSPSDRRVQHVNLTPAGKQSLDEMIPIHYGWISGLMENLDRSQAEALYDLLGELKKSITEGEANSESGRS